MFQPQILTTSSLFVSSHSQKGMNDIVAGVQQYQSSLLDNLKQQMEGVLKKHSGSTTGQLEKDTMDIFNNFIDPLANVATTF